MIDERMKAEADKLIEIFTANQEIIKNIQETLNAHTQAIEALTAAIGVLNSDKIKESK